MLSALAWVPRGAAKQEPDVYEPDQEDVAIANEQESQSVAAAAAARAAAQRLLGAQAEDLDDNDAVPLPGFASLSEMQEIAAQHSQDTDLLAAADQDSDAEQELEDFHIKPTDCLVLGAHSSEEQSFVNVYLFDPDSASLYVHHQIYCPAPPLALAWLDCAPGASSQRNVAAIASFAPLIELWDVDSVDALEPIAVLGGPADEKLAQPKSAKKKNSKNKSQAGQLGLKPDSHTDAVMSLAWNTAARNILASGSADCTFKLWDVLTESCVSTYDSVVAGKVQSLAWHPQEQQTLLAGAFGGQLGVCDVRSPGAAQRFQCGSDIEAVSWVPSNPLLFLASTEDGSVRVFDARATRTTPLMQVQAHDQATTSVSFCPCAPSLMATASVDKSVKLWDILDTGADGTPKHLTTLPMRNVGKLFAASFCPDPELGWLLTTGGSQGTVAVWDSRLSPAVQAQYASLIPQGLSSPGDERVYALAEGGGDRDADTDTDDSDDESDEDGAQDAHVDGSDNDDAV